MGAGSAAAFLGGRGSDAARVSDSRSRLRSNGDAGKGGQGRAPYRRHGDRRREGSRRQEHPGTVSVITGLDHLVVLLEDMQAGAKAYELLLGRAPSWRSRSDGAQTVLFTLDNMSLELMAPADEGPASERIREAMKISGEGLASICFRVDDIGKACRRLDRVALKPEPVAEAESRDLTSDAILRW